MDEIQRVVSNYSTEYHYHHHQWKGMTTEDLIFAYICTLLIATFTIFVGSFVSLSQAVDVRANKKRSHHIVRVKGETMTSRDAYMFPVIGSCILLGLYGAFKYVSLDFVNFLLTLYFLIFSIISLNTSITSFLYWLIPTHISNTQNYHLNYTYLLFPYFQREIKYRFKLVDIACMLSSILFSFWFSWNKNWIANNIFGLSFSIQAISVISPGTYLIACILLGGLFFYDIFWVFGTEVMVTVAKSFDGPIKLLFPKNFFTAIKMNTPFEFSMLGLGDIVIPGIFIALLLRYDLFHRNKRKGNFYICLISYFCGLLLTICIMHIYKRPQPALLYLVPFCVASSIIAAAIRGELSNLFKYTEIIDMNARKHLQNFHSNIIASNV